MERTSSLKTGALTPGASYTLAVNEIQDLVGTGSFPNSQIAVTMALQSPADFGQTANGFQDDFTGARDPNWVAVPPDKDLVRTDQRGPPRDGGWR